MTFRFSSLPQPLRWGLLLLSGGINTLGFAPYNLWFLPLVTPIILFLSLKNASAKQAATNGWLYGLGWFGAGVSWIHVSIAEFGGLPLAGSLALICLLIMYLAIYPALAAYALVKWIPHYRWLFVAPIIWYATEWLRASLFTGFPWLSLGYSQLHGPLHYLAPIIGETGLSWIVLVIASGLYFIPNKEQRKTSIICLASIGLATAAASTYQPIEREENAVSVALVQGNIKQELRWVEENEEPTMQLYSNLTKPLSDTQLIIWPEAAIPRLEAMSQSFLIKLDETLAENQQALVSGIIDYQPYNREIYNSLIVLGSKSGQPTTSYHYDHTNRYQKHHLLPIGEVVPFETILRPLAPIFDLPMSSFNRGSYVQPALQAAGLYLTPVICYEIAFPEQVLANLTHQTDFIVTVSNDAWFGESIGPLQHMQIAQMRALEVGRPVLRATNNGLSGIADEYGNLVASIAQFQQGTLQSEVYPTTGMTFYATYGEAPKYLFYAILLISLSLHSRQRTS